MKKKLRIQISRLLAFTTIAVCIGTPLTAIQAEPSNFNYNSRDNPSGLQMVSFSRADAMITDLAVASYFIDTLGITNLRIAGSIDYVWNLCFATRKDSPQLAKIIEKALNTVSESERIKIKNQWISLREQGWRPGPWFWIALSGFIVLLFIAAIFVWNLTLRQQIRAKTIELQNELTERKRKEEALRESERKYSALVQESPDAIISLDKKGNLLSFNPAAERKSGFSAEEVLGKHFAKIGVLTKQSIPKALKEFALVVTGIERPPFELTIMRKDKSYLFMEANPRLTKHKGEKAWIQVTLRDITDRKRAEEEKKKLQAQLQQAQKMESIGILASGIAHEFNNIMTTIIGNASMLLMSAGEDHSLIEGLEDIKSTGERAADLTRQILAFGRKQMIQPKVLNLNEALKNIESMLVHLIEEHIELKTIYEPALRSVKMDPAQIDQVVINLVNNARDAMSKGGTLTIETANVKLGKDFFNDHGIEKQPGYYVMFSVTDTGTGMDLKTQEHMFEPFFTTKEVGKGTGLGLSTVYGMVKQNHGWIWVDSEPGRGSTFKVYLPVVEINPELLEKERIPEDAPKGSGCILLVEDDHSLRKVVCKILDQYGYQILEAENGEKALKVAGGHDGPIHLMITDVVMPEMSGREVADSLQSLRPEVKVLYMSGYTDSITSHHGVFDKEVNFIEKPFTPEGLALKVREVMDKKQD